MSDEPTEAMKRFRTEHERDYEQRRLANEQANAERDKRKAEVRERLHRDAVFHNVVETAVAEVSFLLDVRIDGRDRDRLRWAAALALLAQEALTQVQTPGSPQEAASGQPGAENETFAGFAVRADPTMKPDTFRLSNETSPQNEHQRICVNGLDCRCYDEPWRAKP